MMLGFLFLLRQIKVTKHLYWMMKIGHLLKLYHKPMFLDVLYLWLPY